MNELSEVAPAFIEMAHRIVWCTAASAGPDNRPRSRILHPLWAFDGDALVGWVGTEPTPLKRAHLAYSPALSLAYWTTTHDHCIADCDARWLPDLGDREAAWERFKSAPAPVVYDPMIIPAWGDGPGSEQFGVLELRPWRLRVFPGSTLMDGTSSAVLTWRASPPEGSR